MLSGIFSVYFSFWVSKWALYLNWCRYFYSWFSTAKCLKKTTQKRKKYIFHSAWVVLDEIRIGSEHFVLLYFQYHHDNHIYLNRKCWQQRKYFLFSSIKTYWNSKVFYDLVINSSLRICYKFTLDFKIIIRMTHDGFDCTFNE